MLASGWRRFPRICNICGYKGAFYPAGFPYGLQLRLDAGCPSCGSLERHRLLKLWLDNNARALSGRVLHFAPEAPVTSIVNVRATDYITADIDVDRNTTTVMNIEQIDLPDESVDAVICSHVLEHVDDTRALPELYRVLTPEGILLVMVPIIDAWPTTYENLSISTDRDRLLHFGQIDHIRYYGRDIHDRITRAGFSLDTFTAQEPYVHQLGLIRGETLFIARK